MFKKIVTFILCDSVRKITGEIHPLGPVSPVPDYFWLDQQTLYLTDMLEICVLRVSDKSIQWLKLPVNNLEVREAVKCLSGR